MQKDKRRGIKISTRLTGSTKYNLVPIWECKKPLLKKVWFKKEFTACPHFILYDFEVISAPLNKHLTDDLTYLSRHTPKIVAIHELRACIFTLRCLTNVTPTYYFFDFFPTSPDLVRTPPRLLIFKENMTMQLFLLYWSRPRVKIKKKLEAFEF